jgi:nucleotide-binding universal stress UspA family protein
MSSARAPSFCILAAVDYSDTASLVVQEAVELSRQKHAQQLHFLHVNHASPDDAGQQARHAELLEWLGARLSSPPGVAREARVVGHELSGDPAKLIVEMAADLSADMVVVGTHGRTGVQRLLLGSVAASVVQRCACPVLVVRPKLHHDPALQIEPPCPRCVQARAQSQGKDYWCVQHAERHGRRHTYYDPHASSWVTRRILP